jgi:hypothetical protein
MMRSPKKYTKQATVIVLKRPHFASAIIAARIGVMYARNWVCDQCEKNPYRTLIMGVRSSYLPGTYYSTQ